MEKQLNIKKIDAAMSELGLNKAGLSEKLGVSRTIVSAWFKGAKFPRPDKLLNLGRELNLTFHELVLKSLSTKEPIIAFRKKGGRITKDFHLSKAMEMGQLLELLVPYIPNDRFFQPPALKKPELEYRYIQKVADRIRKEISTKNLNIIEFDQIIRKINEFETILIPVFHGDKDNHENALHIFLPSSKITWIYLNLDTNVHDFKFWMAHELGHVLSPSLRGEEAEDFADAFAQAFLFSEELAENTYGELKRLKKVHSRIRKILDLSKSLTISPVTIYKAITNFALEHGYEIINLEPHIYAVSQNLYKNYLNVSESLRGNRSLTAELYIDITLKKFKSKFFDILRLYLSENDKSSGFIQSILDTSFLDAKEIHAELVK